MPTTVCGLSLPESFDRIAGVVSITSPPLASVASTSVRVSGCAAAPSSARNSQRGSTLASRASVAIRRPSARNSSSARRWRFSRSSRIRLTSGFERLSMRLRRPDMASILAEAVLDQPDQLEECGVGAVAARVDGDAVAFRGAEHHQPHDRRAGDAVAALFNLNGDRSEEHTSELQSLMRISYAVFCLNKKNQE